MSEDVIINNEDIEAVEKEVLEKAKAKEDELKNNIETKLKTEMEADRKAKENAETLIKLKEENEAMVKMLKEKEVEKEEAITVLKEQIGTSKAIHNQSIPKAKVLDLDESAISDINEDSKLAFLKKYGLTEAQWKGR